MAEFPALPLFTDAYLGDTTHLTVTEHGAYLLLLMAQWRSRDCMLPNDDKLLARYAKMTPQEWSDAKPILEQFFMVNGCSWVQRRLADERKYVEVRRAQNIKAGKVSALKRKGRHSTPVSTDVPTEPQQKTNQPTPLTPNPLLKEPLSEVPKNPEPKPKKEKRSERLESFLEREGETPTAKAWGEWALAEGMTVAQIDAEMAKFRDWWLAAPAGKGLKADWFATWRTWARKFLADLRKEEQRNEIFRRKFNR